MESSYQVIPMSEKRWIVRKIGSKRASKAFNTEKEAIIYGLKISNNKTDLFIHDEYGMVDDMLPANAEKRWIKAMKKKYGLEEIEKAS
jgi:hypothetical protein